MNMLAEDDLSKVERKAREHWTPDRTRKLTAGKNLPLHPGNHARFLFVTGLLNRDGTLSADQVRKFLQVNHMVSLVMPALQAVARAMPGKELNLLDAGCGNSYLSLALAYLAKHHVLGSLRVFGVDSNAKVIEQSRARAATLGLGGDMEFQACLLEEASLPERLHMVLALHACDTATDAALALALHRKADAIAVAPCCQAELARHFKEMSASKMKSALAVLIHSPNLRRDGAATFTDAIRMALVRALGYEVTATEFVPSAHTPKNRLLLGERRGNYNKEAFLEFLGLRSVLGDAELALEKAVSGLLAERGLTRAGETP